MSRVMLGASVLLAIACFSSWMNLSAQGADPADPFGGATDGADGADGGAGGYGAAGGRGGEGGYGGRGGGGGRGGRGGYGGGYGEAEAATEYGGRVGAGGRGGRGGYGGEYGGEYGGGRFGGGEYGSRGYGMEVPNAAKRIEAALRETLKAPLEYEDQPLNEIISILQEEYEIPIIFDNAALEEVAISPDTEVTINLRNITLRSALNHILRQPGLEDLTYAVNDEVLLITTEEKANERLIVAVYQVDDLVDVDSERKTDKQSPFSPLVKVITQSVEYDTWMANGHNGEGEIHLMKPGILVVSQTQNVQIQVVDLLAKLRETRKSIEQKNSSPFGF